LADRIAAAGKLSAADVSLLGEAIELSRRCPVSRRAYSVGAVLAGPDGTVIATGYSRESDPADHAEEVALAKAAEHGWPRAGDPEPGPGPPAPAAATLYSSLEPCLHRSSRPRPCAELILAAGLRRVVIAWLEPPVLAPGGGAAWLRERGIVVIEVPSLAGRARAVNAHLLAG
jgi:diaminohydroxyphosphoribosylaminopyrimidine deaminase/5-amino-6-(5-phosphoribosylamino)uracil reductase